jgi:hypothetical protein
MDSAISHTNHLFWDRDDLQTALYVITDSGFKAQDPDCLGIRGELVELGEDASHSNVCSSSSSLGGIMQWLHHRSSKQPRVTRSSFASELMSLLDAVSNGIFIDGLVREIEFGTTSAIDLYQMVEKGGFGIHWFAIIDEKLVFNAIIAPEVKPPSDKHLHYAVLKMREWLDLGVVDRIIWIDNCAMLADGMTKGSATRADILAAMTTGMWQPAVPFLVWESPHKPQRR